MYILVWCLQSSWRPDPESRKFSSSWQHPHCTCVTLWLRSQFNRPGSKEFHRTITLCTGNHQLFSVLELTPTTSPDSPEFLSREKEQIVDPDAFSTGQLWFCRPSLCYLSSRLKQTTLRGMESKKHPLTVSSAHLSLSSTPCLRQQPRTASHIQDTGTPFIHPASPCSLPSSSVLFLINPNWNCWRNGMGTVFQIFSIMLLYLLTTSSSEHPQMSALTACDTLLCRAETDQSSL